MMLEQDGPGKTREALRAGMVIPAHPLALTAGRTLDERRQRALSRYYLAAGAGGLAVGVHTTQFAIREVGLYETVLRLAADEMRGRSVVGVAGICGATPQAVREAGAARDLGYDAGLLSLGALREAPVADLLDHCRAVARVIPLFGFYLQPGVGGRVLPYEFWRQFVEIPEVLAIKVAPFNRYRTLDVVRSVAESGRAGEIALYTGNDDSILVDLMTEFDFGGCKARFAGGLLGHWAVWTSRAVEHLRMAYTGGDELLTLASQITDANAAIFDTANGFAGCIPGIHEVLRRQGLLEGCWCLDPHEELSPGQVEEIDRVSRLYPHLLDDEFVRRHLSEWMG
jgi:dihydrodipicolinate synthase/N-acetylneuraminate lyase